MRDKAFVHNADDSYPVRTAAVTALLRFGDRVLDPLVAEFAVGDVNKHIGQALVALGDTARRGAPRLVAACLEAGSLTAEGLDALLREVGGLLQSI